MSGKSLKIQENAKYSLLLIAGFGLAGCDENGAFQMPSFGAEETASEQGTAPALAALGGNTVERDVEAPDVFSITDAGLWDGRPSLGGVWVAHPDVTDPERVIIRNQANGQFVIGALFRRERENPGPSLQVSSDAAEALGLLAGAPSQLSVIALRREEAPAAAEVVDPVAAVALDAPAEVTATPLDGDTALPVAGRGRCSDCSRRCERRSFDTSSHTSPCPCSSTNPCQHARKAFHPNRDFQR